MMNRRGSLLILSYVLIAFIVTWGTSGFRRSVTELHASERYIDTHQSFNLAEAGMSAAEAWLDQQPTPPAGTLAFDPFGGVPQTLSQGTFTVLIDPDDTNAANYLDHYTITATGRESTNVSTRTLSLLVRTESFARYSYFTNSERLPNGNPIWFTSRDHLQGPVHSNDQFNIAGSPVFDGLVSSTAGSINYKNPPPTGGNNPEFNGGLALNAGGITMPSSVAKLRVAAATSGLWYEGNTTIRLQSNGTMLVTNPAAGLVNQPTSLPANGAVFVNGGDVTVSGTLDGTVSIGTSETILIDNDIRYADNPVVNPDSNDVLGLVAEKNIVVDNTAPYDITIQASLMALDTSFTVEEWWVGPPKGTLSVYGGIIQSSRGPVGTFSSSTGNKLSGYSKDYVYDERMASTAPPFFPTTGLYEELLWQEQ
jgi:hypothetical protein